MLRIAAVLAVLVAFAAPTSAAEPIQLFNGKDLSGWAFASRDPNVKMEEVWSVKDGVIHCVGKPVGYLRTEKDFTNFILKVQWRVVQKGNSGVLVRMQCPPDKVWPRGMECQLNTGDSGDIWNIDKFPMTVDESRTKGRRTVKMHEGNEKPLGEWNQYEITCDGPNLELKVNGLVQNTATNCAELPGKICLQAEGAEIEFRNLELTPLESKIETKEHIGPTAIGRDLANWSGYMKDGSDWKDAWKVNKGVLQYAGGKNGFIYTNKDYANYMLRAQYRFVDKPGDSGLLLHVTPEDKIWPKCFEAQGKADAGGDVWLLNGMKPTVKGNHIARAHESSESKLGEWNQYDITAQGDKIDLRLNYVLQNSVTGVDPQSGRIALQAQDVPVEFKDVQIWQLFDPKQPRDYKRVEGLDGWHVTGVGNWSYKDGVIEGWQPKNVHTYTHLVTDKSYKDFKITMKYMCPMGNSGLYFRIIEDTNGDVHGIQSEIDAHRDAGGMYESWGRGWLSQPSKADAKANFKEGEWNEMTVEGHGPNVVVHVNGWKAAEINDPNVQQEGHFALQIHGGQDVDVLFKDIKIEELESK